MTGLMSSKVKFDDCALFGKKTSRTILAITYVMRQKNTEITKIFFESGTRTGFIMKIGKTKMTNSESMSKNQIAIQKALVLIQAPLSSLVFQGA